MTIPKIELVSQRLLSHLIFTLISCILKLKAKFKQQFGEQLIFIKTATALQELHNLGYAHLDLRLSNICFTANGSDYHVILIDLD